MKPKNVKEVNQRHWSTFAVSFFLAREVLWACSQNLNAPDSAVPASAYFVYPLIVHLIFFVPYCGDAVCTVLLRVAGKAGTPLTKTNSISSLGHSQRAARTLPPTWRALAWPGVPWRALMAAHDVGPTVLRRWPMPLYRRRSAPLDQSTPVYARSQPALHRHDQARHTSGTRWCTGPRSSGTVRKRNGMAPDRGHFVASSRKHSAGTREKMASFNAEFERFRLTGEASLNYNHLLSMKDTASLTIINLPWFREIKLSRRNTFLSIGQHLWAFSGRGGSLPALDGVGLRVWRGEVYSRAGFRGHATQVASNCLHPTHLPLRTHRGCARPFALHSWNALMPNALVEYTDGSGPRSLKRKAEQIVASTRNTCCLWRGQRSVLKLSENTWHAISANLPRRRTNKR